MNDIRADLKRYADAYRVGVHEHFWLCLKEDLENLCKEKRMLACKFLSKGQIDDAKRQNYMADSIQEVIDRPRYVIDITSSPVRGIYVKARNTIENLLK